jgi:pyruvate formate lyase activating enzyme
MSIKGVIFNIQRFSVNDGPGIRTTVFMKGCPLCCGWCHNPEGRDFEPFKLDGETIGKVYTDGELYSEVEKDRIFYEESGGGVTFSGGEPLSQPEFLNSILKLCKENGIQTAVDTSGYADKALFKMILPHTDLFLFDLKLADPVSHLKYAGVSNTEILENLEYLLKKNARVIIRIPMIPKITATDENINSILDILKRVQTKPEINLIPYHRIADSKYLRFGLKNIMTGIKELSETELQEYRNQFETAGYTTKIGG